MRQQQGTVLLRIKTLGIYPRFSAFPDVKTEGKTFRKSQFILQTDRQSRIYRATLGNRLSTRFLILGGWKMSRYCVFLRIRIDFFDFDFPKRFFPCPKRFGIAPMFSGPSVKDLGTGQNGYLPNTKFSPLFEQYLRKYFPHGELARARERWTMIFIIFSFVECL